MSRTFLGKPVPTPKVNTGTTKISHASKPNRTWLGMAVGALGIFAFAGFSMAYVPNLAIQPNNDNIAVAGYSNDRNEGTSVILADAPASTVENPCDGLIDTKTGLFVNMKPIQVFPLIDESLNKKNGCNPTYWNMKVVYYFIYKALYLLNWFAGVLAVLLTVYAGLLYISGFANEANVKQAKTLLISCYVGLAIVFGARIILLGFASTLTGEANNTSLGNILTPE